MISLLNLEQAFNIVSLVKNHGQCLLPWYEDDEVLRDKGELKGWHCQS